MTRILLTGIVGSDKTGLVNQTIDSGKELGIKVDSISLGEIFLDRARRSFEVSPSTLDRVSETVKVALRQGVSEQALSRMLRLEPDDHVIIDTPLTLLDPDGIPTGSFDIRDFGCFEEAGRPLDRAVCLIDSPNEIARRIRETGYCLQTNKGILLPWMASEVQRTRDFGDIYTRHSSLVMPRGYSDSSLLKLILDPLAVIIYLAYPISCLKNRSDLKEKISKFRENLNLYGLVVSPIEIQDQSDGKIEKVHTYYRDLYWFVRQARCIVAYFPEDIRSSGVKREMDEATQIGKTRILIHPNPDNTPFGDNVDYHFRSPDEFFEAVLRSREESEYNDLQMFLDPTSSKPRYHMLEGYQK